MYAKLVAVQHVAALMEKAGPPLQIQQGSLHLTHTIIEAENQNLIVF
jgi:hypothetical protein